MKRILAGASFVLTVLTVASFLQAQSHEASAARFVGEWVGLQTWATDNPPPNIHGPQPVSFKIELIDGKVVGVMMPFMGGSDGASFIDGHVVGQELKGSAVMGPPRLPTAAPPRRNPPRWKGFVNIDFTFVVAGGNNDELLGTADVRMEDVKWMTYKYELKKKRSRY
jgi:hypothetical protein